MPFVLFFFFLRCASTPRVHKHAHISTTFLERLLTQRWFSPRFALSLFFYLRRRGATAAETQDTWRGGVACATRNENSIKSSRSDAKQRWRKVSRQGVIRSGRLFLSEVFPSFFFSLFAIPIALASLKRTSRCVRCFSWRLAELTTHYTNGKKWSWLRDR